MDGSRFDDLARSWSTSRRGVIRTILGGVVASVAGAVAAQDASGKNDKNPYGFKRSDPFYNLYGRCKKPEQCGSATKCNGELCYPTACKVGDDIVPDQTENPSNPCQFCSPNSSITAWSGWSNRADGMACENTSGSPCLALFGTCIDGRCHLEPAEGVTDCGDGQVCCHGACCPAGMACGASGACEPVDIEPEPDPDPDPDPGEDEEEEEDDPPPVDPNPCPDGGDCESEEPRCIIGGVPYGDGVTNPDMDCQVCDAISRPAGWTNKPDNETCGGVPNRYCCQGICCPPGQCCNRVGLCALNVDFACPDLIEQGN